MKLIDYLLKEGYFIYQEVANTYLLSGQILVDGKRITDANAKVKKNPYIQILDGSNMSFSTDGMKLTEAMQRMGVFAMGKDCIDFVATRGGVSESLLGGGANRVYTYYLQDRNFSRSLLHSPLCVANMVQYQHKTFDPLGTIAHIRQNAPHAHLAVIHEGQNGVRKLLPYFREIIGAGEIIWHIKPLKEINIPLAKRLGVINEKSYLPFLQQLIQEVNSIPGLAVQNICAGDHTYYAGMPEFYLYILSGLGIQGFHMDDAFLRSVIQEAIANTKVNKHSFIKRFGHIEEDAPAQSRQEESVIPLNTYKKKVSLFDFLRRKKPAAKPTETAASSDQGKRETLE